MAKKTKKYALGGQLNSRQVMPLKPMGGVGPRPSQAAPIKDFKFKSQGERPYNTKPTGPVASPSQIISAFNKSSAPANSIQTALKNAPRVTPEIQGMADMASAIARGPRPNPLNPTGSINGPRFGGMGMKKGGKVKSSSASKRADGIATKGKTKGRII